MVVRLGIPSVSLTSTTVFPSAISSQMLSARTGSYLTSSLRWIGLVMASVLQLPEHRLGRAGVETLRNARFDAIERGDRDAVVLGSGEYLCRWGGTVLEQRAEETLGDVR